MALHGPHHVAKQSTMTVFWSLTTFLNSSALFYSLSLSMQSLYRLKQKETPAHVLTWCTARAGRLAWKSRCDATPCRAMDEAGRNMRVDSIFDRGSFVEKIKKNAIERVGSKGN